MALSVDGTGTMSNFWSPAKNSTWPPRLIVPAIYGDPVCPAHEPVW
jgi:hypothetical protein